MIIEGILEQALTHIINHPDEFNQAEYFTDTTTDLAGRICLLAGAEPVPHRAPYGALSGGVSYLGHTTSACEVAEEVAGLTRWEGAWLWQSERTMPELYEAVMAISQDIAPQWWQPSYDVAYGMHGCDSRGTIHLAVHRRTSAEYIAGRWHRRTHPTRHLAHIWAMDRARQLGLTTHFESTRKEGLAP